LPTTTQKKSEKEGLRRAELKKMREIKKQKRVEEKRERSGREEKT